MSDWKSMLLVMVVAAVVGLLWQRISPNFAIRWSQWSQSPERYGLHAMSTLLFATGLVFAIAERDVMYISISAIMTLVAAVAYVKARQQIRSGSET